MVLYVVYVVASRLVQVIEFPKSLAMLSRSTFSWQRWNFWDSYPAFPQNCFDFPTDVDTSESAKDLMKRLICSAEVSSSSYLYFINHHNHIFDIISTVIIFEIFDWLSSLKPRCGWVRTGSWTSSRTPTSSASIGTTSPSQLLLIYQRCATNAICKDLLNGCKIEQKYFLKEMTFTLVKSDYWRYHSNQFQTQNI